MPGHTNNAVDLFRYDRVEGTIRCLSEKSSDPQLSTKAAGDSSAGLLSDDANTVVFTSYSLNLARGIQSGSYTHTNRLY